MYMCYIYIYPLAAARHVEEWKCIQETASSSVKEPEIKTILPWSIWIFLVEVKARGHTCSYYTCGPRHVMRVTCLPQRFTLH